MIAELSLAYVISIALAGAGGISYAVKKKMDKNKVIKLAKDSKTEVIETACSIAGILLDEEKSIRVDQAYDKMIDTYFSKDGGMLLGFARNCTDILVEYNLDNPEFAKILAVQIRKKIEELIKLN